MKTDEAGATDGAAKARRAAFVSAAREAFFTAGYAGTTMSSIAQTVGGSKTTLWSYFPSKELLFAAVVDEIVELHVTALSVAMPVDQSIEEVLRGFGKSLLETIYSPPILALHRLVAGEAERFPHLAALFYERGPALGKARLAAYISCKMEDGTLRTGDPQLAARQFAGLCQGSQFHGVLFGNHIVPGQALRDSEIVAAVESFCRAWKAGTETSLAG